MRLVVLNKVLGDVLTTTWVCSGMFPVPITSALLGQGGAVVQSVNAVSSGHGYYYARHQLPTVPTKFINEWRAWINSFEYVNRLVVNVRAEDQD